MNETDEVFEDIIGDICQSLDDLHDWAMETLQDMEYDEVTVITVGNILEDAKYAIEKMVW